MGNYQPGDRVWYLNSDEPCTFEGYADRGNHYGLLKLRFDNGSVVYLDGEEALAPPRVMSAPMTFVDRIRQLRKVGYSPQVANRIAYDDQARELAARDAVLAEYTDADGNPLPGKPWPPPPHVPPGPRHVCPECGETVHRRPPEGAGTGSMLDVEPGRQEWSHNDGEPLCPVMTGTGYQPALPREVGPPWPHRPPVDPDTRTQKPSTATPSRSSAKEASVSTAEEPQNMQELAHFLDTGVEEAEGLAERARRLEEIADSDLRLTPRLKEAIAEAAGACKLASEAVGELPGVLRSDLDV